MTTNTALAILSRKIKSTPAQRQKAILTLMVAIRKDSHNDHNENTD